MSSGQPATKPERSPGTLERFDSEWNTTQWREGCIAARVRCLQQRWRGTRLVEEQLRVALVGGDHEVVTLRALQHDTELREWHHCAGGVTGTAEVEELAALPDFLGDRVEIRQVAVFGDGVQIPGLGPCKQRPRLRRSDRTDWASTPPAVPCRRAVWHR